VVPCVGFGVAHNRPPCLSMIERLIDNPMPIPPGLLATSSTTLAAPIIIQTGGPVR